MGILPEPGGGVSRVVDEVRQALARFGVAGPGVVAVSGGADSVALLRALLDAGQPQLTVAHFNHQLRGDESDADEAFVRTLADQLGLPFRCGRRDLRAEVTASGENLEAAARQARYDWLQTVGGSWIATGHTADDQAETVLHRLVRGTGVQGLRGIAPSKTWRAAGFIPAVRIVRPLLALARADLLAYLSSLSQSYRTDSSNADPRFTRNRIRHELLPLVKTFNPEAVAVLGRLAEQAGDLTDYIRQEAGRWLWEAELPRAGTTLVFDANVLHTVPPLLCRELFRLAWEREGWPANSMTRDHWHRLAALTAGDYPDGVALRQVGKVVQLGRRS